MATLKERLEAAGLSAAEIREVVGEKDPPAPERPLTDAERQWGMSAQDWMALSPQERKAHYRQMGSGGSAKWGDGWRAAGTVRRPTVVNNNRPKVDVEKLRRDLDRRRGYSDEGRIFTRRKRS